MIICIKCGTPIDDAANYCSHCGCAQKKTASAPAKKKKSTRRTYGSGTIRKLSGRRLPYAAYMPRRLGGGYIGSFETSAGAANALAVAISQSPASKRIDWRVRDFYEAFTSSADYARLSAQMKNCYCAAWKYMQDIADLKMRDVKASHWQSCINVAVTAGKSRATCENIRLLASRLCSEAMKDDIIDRDYSKLLSLPAEKAKAKDIFTESELRILQENDNDIRAQIILLLIYSGMRIGELLALKVSDVYDGYFIGGEKTTAGRNRIIPILPNVAQYVYQMTEGTEPNAPLVRWKGKSVSISFYRRTLFYAYLAELGILTEEEIQKGGTPRLTPHCTRHTFATLAVQAGIDKTVITRVIGHTDFETTDRHYVDLQAKFLCGQMAKIANEIPAKV